MVGPRKNPSGRGREREAEREKDRGKRQREKERGKEREKERENEKERVEERGRERKREAEREANRLGRSQIRCLSCLGVRCVNRVCCEFKRVSCSQSRRAGNRKMNSLFVNAAASSHDRGREARKAEAEGVCERHVRARSAACT